MAIQLTIEEASKLLESWLIDASLDRVSYFITGWELGFLGRKSGELLLYAAEIQSSKTEELKAIIPKLPIDFLDTNEPDDVAIAIELFSVINKWRIGDTQLDPTGRLSIKFENSVQIDISSELKMVDWTWFVKSEGDLKQLTCDSGSIFLSDTA